MWGGVLLTNGWDRDLRKKAATEFGFDLVEMAKRHEMVFDLYERGKMSFNEYLEWTIFYTPRTFTLEEVKNFVFNQSKPYQEMIDFIKHVKREYGLKIGALSNEGREIAVDRIERFNMTSFIDFFIISSFVHFRKPDRDMYRLAIDVAQVAPHEICYIDDRALLVESGKALGLHAICNSDFASTRAQLENYLGVSSIT